MGACAAASSRVPRRNEIGGVGEHPPIDVAERHHIDRSHLDHTQQIGLAVPAGPDEPDALSSVGQLLCVAGETGKRAVAAPPVTNSRRFMVANYKRRRAGPHRVLTSRTAHLRLVGILKALALRERPPQPFALCATDPVRHTS
jgi:hypothetical protein